MEATQDGSDPIQEHSGPEETAPPAKNRLLSDEPTLPKRGLLGSMKSQFIVPDDIKSMFADEIEEMFYGPDAMNKFDRIAQAADERRRQELETKD